jgi:adenosine deaminase
MTGIETNRKVRLVTIPKVELHVHLEGTAPPSLIRRLAARHGVPVPDGLLTEDDRFPWRDFLHFLELYRLAASVIRTAEDYRDVTYEYLTACAREGAIYVELTASPDQAAAAGLSDAEHYAGIAQGIDDARAETGIDARILVSCVRELGAERAVAIAAHAASRPHPYLVGFGMAGDEAGFPPAPYARAFAIAAEAGLGCVAHAGEHAGPDSVRGVLELPIARIEHGVRAVEDPALVAELAERDIVLDVCPTSNVALRVFADYERHPFLALRAAGVRVTLGSDDPPYFDATIGGEYAIARERFGLTDAELLDISRTAVDAAFAEPELKHRLNSRLAASGGNG